MPKIKLNVGGRPYEIACNDGEEDHIKQLAENLNSRVVKIAKSLPIASESMLLLVTALMMEDEIGTLNSNKETAPHKDETPASIPYDEEEIKERINRCVTDALLPFTEKLEALANSLEV